MKKPISLIAIASSQNAKIFEKIGKKNFDLHLICEIEATSDLEHDNTEYTFDRVSPGRHDIEPHTNRRQVEKHQFANKISKTLTGLDYKNHYDDLVIMASHKMLEELDKTLNNMLKQKISHKLPKDIVSFPNHEIKEYVGETLESI